jgi:hypothetical protein
MTSRATVAPLLPLAFAVVFALHPREGRKSTDFRFALLRGETRARSESKVAGFLLISHSSNREVSPSEPTNVYRSDCPVS